MNQTTIHQGARFDRPLYLHTRPSDRITGPFYDRPLRPARHDMLLLNIHPEILPLPEPAPQRDLTFFNLDRP